MIKSGTLNIPFSNLSPVTDDKDIRLNNIMLENNIRWRRKRNIFLAMQFAMLREKFERVSDDARSVWRHTIRLSIDDLPASSFPCQVSDRYKLWLLTAA